MLNDKGIRILFIIPYLSGGGAERVVSIWASKLVEMGFAVDILVFFRVENEYKVSEKVTIHSMAESKKSYKKINPLKKIILIRSFIKKADPKFVLPFVTYVGIATNLARIGLRVKLIESIRNNPWEVPNKRKDRIKRNISAFFSNACIVQNSEQRNYFPKYIQRKMVVIPNPISSELKINKKVYSENKIKKIVTIGRLETQKNQKLLIEAFSNIALKKKDIILQIYGEGSLYKELECLINKLNMKDRVILCGRTSDVIAALSDADLFVLSSNYEGMPNALMEAMAIGLPCISTNCPTGPSDLINNGYDGILIEVGNKSALENQILDLIENPDKGIVLGKRARENIIHNFNIDVSTNKLKRLFMNF
ncbi:glycosyltransferase family 4 protein [Lederbergia ruris]|uniref:glycosyltransferase family 4 protein n=1 Tax=Lederbergia ruris TaxID=217495 RepID=UPI0039A3988C